MEEQPNKNHSNNGAIETSKAERAVYLMKCPRLVSRCFSSPPSDGSDPSRPVAKVILSIDPLHSNDDDSPTQFTMELAGTESGLVPKSFAMDMSKDFIPMSVFSESMQGNISVEGKVLNKFDMRPHDQNLETYGNLCRQRTNKCMTRNRQIQVIENDSGAHMVAMPGMFFTTSATSDKKKVQAKTTEMKRTRRDRGEMEEIVFKLFERQPNWSLRQLVQETDQPEQFLKDILKELCIYNNKGANQGTYELKPEYRRSGESTAK